MMRIFKSLAACMLGVLCSTTVMAQRNFESVAGDPMQARIYTLSNGLKVYLSVNKETPRVQTYIAVRTGSRNDPAETTGLAHYLEHIMFKGTTHFGTSDMQAEQPFLDDIERRYEHYRTVKDSAQRKRLYHEIDSVSQLAAQYNIPNEYDKMMAAIGSEGSDAYTSNDVTCYIEDIPANEIDNWARVQADRFQNLVIRGFHTELESVYEEYNMGLAKDNHKLFDALMAKLFPAHPYGTQTTIGRGEHLKNPSIKNIKEYYRRYYVPNNVAICMAGDLDPEQTMDVIEKYFGKWRPNPTLNRPEYPALQPITSPSDTTVVGPEAETLFLAWRFPEGNSLTCDTLQLLSQVLYNGTAGLLDLNINQKMKAQTIYATTESLTDYSAFLMGGYPKQGQSLEEVHTLALEELEKIKQGEFSEELLPSIINNLKRDRFKDLLSNEKRADQFVDAFINAIPWAQMVGQTERMEGITKQQLVSFARRNLKDNYVCIYKRQGEGFTLPKVEKPAITPIPTNSHLQSAFLQEITNQQPAPIQPVFADWKRDLTQGKTAGGNSILYKENKQDDLFTLQLRFPLGSEVNPMYDVAADYLDYLGTDKLSNQQIKEQFYSLACEYSFQQSDDEFLLTLEGLDQNLTPAVGLLWQLMHNAQADSEAYEEMVEIILKEREDAKTNQQSNFRALTQYAQYGPYNALRNQPSAKQLRKTKPEELLNMMRNLLGHPYTLLYHGKQKMQALSTIAKMFEKGTTPVKRLPKARKYTQQQTKKAEVFLAPYDAKNIYMSQYLNEGRQWTPQNAAIISLFNAYFGGGMNAIVFQEMREARGLAYSASAYYSQPRRSTDNEQFNTTIATQNDKMTDCIRQFAVLLDSMPLRPAGFELAQQSLRKSIATERQTRFAVLRNYYNNQKLGLQEPLNKTIYEALPGLTLTDLNHFAQTHIAQKPYRFVILGNESELDMKTLKKIGKIRRLKTKDIFGY